MGKIVVNENKESWWKVVIETFKLLLILPLIPLAFGVVYFFAWLIRWRNNIPEDLDAQFSKNEDNM